MLKIFKNITGELLNEPIGDVKLISSITGDVQQEDYINIIGLIAYLQNLTRTEVTKSLVKPINFGLPNSNNITMLTLEIDY